jgi:hypothetical protein
MKSYIQKGWNAIYASIVTIAFLMAYAWIPHLPSLGLSSTVIDVYTVIITIGFAPTVATSVIKVFEK